MTRDHAELQALLGEYLDGELPPELHAEMERHLDGCPRCPGEMDSLLALRAEAGALPREIAPPRDLWPEIRARLEGADTPPAARTEVVDVDFRTRRRIRWRWGLAAAASVALVVLSSGVTAYLLRQPAAPVAVAPAAEALPPATAVGLAAFRASQDEYRATVETLRRELAARQDRLTPETRATVQRNLQIIDQAIVEAQAALAADPSNTELPHLLTGVYRKKVELLQDAVTLSASS